MRHAFIFIFIFILLQNTYAQKNSSIKEGVEEIQKLRNLSNNSDLNIGERIIYAEEGVLLSKRYSIDSSYLKSERSLALLYFQNGNLEKYLELSTKNLQLAIKISDSNSIAKANSFIGFYHHYNEKYDSAYYYYYRSVKLFNALNNSKSEVEVLANMASIQEVERDYVGSEKNLIKVISIVDEFPETEENLDLLWKSHNLYAIISAELQEYKRALEYHEKALGICDKMEDSYENRLFSNINISALYRRKGDFVTAERLYEKLHKDESVLAYDPTSYSIILSGLAHAKFKNGTTNNHEIKKLFNEAYSISKKEEDDVGLLSVSMDMAEFYLEIKNIDSARHYVDNAYKIGKELIANETILEALLLKSKIETGNEAKSSLNKYIKLSDSLQKAERSIRNKFARIDYETDQIKAEKDKVSKERFWFLLLSMGLFVTLALLYVIITQRSKNKELKFAQEQQQTNEEIYNLMLSQQDKIDEARSTEKRRISEELHDGILGRLFGTRLSLDSLNRSTTEEAIKSRENYIDELQAIEQEIRKVSHELNTDFVSGSGFSDIIKTLLETQTRAYKLEYKLINDDAIHWDNVSNKTKIHIYRILQESLQNIYKHANASIVEISFNIKNNVICITIIDNGSGFEVNKSKKGIGIKNITSRVKEIQGELKIESQINKGTTITITIPI